MQVITVGVNTVAGKVRGAVARNIQQGATGSK